jgi:hypothetical protein
VLLVFNLFCRGASMITETIGPATLPELAVPCTACEGGYLVPHGDYCQASCQTLKRPYRLNGSAIERVSPSSLKAAQDEGIRSVNDGRDVK